MRSGVAVKTAYGSCMASGEYIIRGQMANERSLKERNIVIDVLEISRSNITSAPIKTKYLLERGELLARA